MSGISIIEIQIVLTLMVRVKRRLRRSLKRNKNSNNAHAIILIAYTGMRVGEMTALKWKNVNLEERYIDIVESTGRIKDKNGKYVAVDKRREH